MKNILFISPTGGYAGIDVCLEMLVCGLDRTRYNPIVIFPLTSRLKPEFEKKGIRCYSLPLNWWFPVSYAGNDLINVLPTLREKIEPLVQIIRDDKIDLVVSNTTVGLDGALAAGIANVPHIFFAHAQFVSNIYTNMTEQVKAQLYCLMGELSDRFICCSKLLCDEMNQYIENADYILNGVDTEKFLFHQRSRADFKNLNMVCVGHYNPNKQQDFVLRALDILRRENPEALKRVHFTMMGPGEKEYIAQLKDLVKKNSLSEFVTFEGFHEDVAQRLNDYTVYINSSITENFPLSVLEAMANGLPVLAAPNDGTRQLVEEGKTGYICDTPQKMAEKILFLLQHPEVLEDFSVQARSRVEEQFSKEVFIKNFQESFDSVLAQSSPNSQRAKLTWALYGLLTSPKRNCYMRLKVLVIYPKEANASFVLAAQIPLDVLKESDLVQYQAITPAELTEQQLNWADIVYCIRFYDDNIYHVLKKAQKRKKPFVWYIDDNYFALRIDEHGLSHTSVENQSFERMFLDSSAVIVNSGELYHIGNLLESRVYRLPTYQIVDQIKSKTPVAQKPFVRFGFMGTLGRDQDFAFVVPALERVVTQYGGGVYIDFIGYAPEELKGKDGVSTFDFIPDYQAFRDFFKTREWDFALAPLADTLFNRSKTNNKYREYSSFGVPGIYSDVITYNSCVKDGENGLLVKNQPDCWYNAICRMIDSPSLREDLGKRAFRDICENYPVQEFADKLIDVFQNVTNLADDSGKNLLGRDDILCFSKNIFGKRRYKLSCPNRPFNRLGILFASEEGRCEGNVEFELFSDRGNLLASAKKTMRMIDYNRWTYFEIPEIDRSESKSIQISLSFVYNENSNHMGVYEDRRRRTFLYRILNRAGLHPQGKNVLAVDFANDRDKKEDAKNQ